MKKSPKGPSALMTAAHREPGKAGSFLTSQVSGISVKTEMKSLSQLSNAERRFILHWGEMGTKWGINRTVAQVHALLYLSPTAQC